MGGVRVDPAVAPSQQSAATNVAALSRKQLADRARVRVKADLPVEVKQAVAAEAARLETSESQVVAFLLAWALHELRAGNAELVEALETARVYARALRFLTIADSRRFSGGSLNDGAADGCDDGPVVPRHCAHQMTPPVGIPRGATLASAVWAVGDDLGLQAALRRPYRRFSPFSAKIPQRGKVKGGRATCGTAASCAERNCRRSGQWRVVEGWPAPSGALSLNV